LDSANRTALSQLGQLYSRNGEYAKALSSFLRLIALDSANSYYYKQAGMLAARSNEFMIAKFLFEKALKLNSDDIESALGLGNIFMEMQHYEKVDSIVQQSLFIDPAFRPMLVLQAKSAFEQHHYEAVIPTVNSLLEKSDTTGIYARMLGVSYYHLKDFDNVVTCMTYLLRNRYDFDWIYFYMGVATRELGNVPASVRWLKLAAQKSISDNTKIYYSQLGQSFEDMGNYEEAIRAYRTAYNYSKDGILLYHLARNYDVYYEDKATAALYYQKYLESDDTIRLAREYARKRMQDMGHF
jgi:tetratricopeptide (TPR) repeat protein